MEKQIPVSEIEINGKKVEIYKWLTLEESTEYSEIALGEVDITDEKKLSEVVLTSRIWGKLNQFLIKHLCKSPGYEEIFQWSPQDRNELIEKLRDLLEKN